MQHRDPRHRNNSKTQKAPAPAVCAMLVDFLVVSTMNIWHGCRSDPVGRPPSTDTQTGPSPQVVCSQCLSSYGPGQKHDCSEKTRRNNLEDLIRLSSTPSKEKIISSQLKEIFREKHVSDNVGTVSLATGGRPISASLGQSKVKPPTKFSNDALNK